MSDVRELLDQAVGSISPVPAEETIEADVLRGRAALARARRRRMIRSSVIGAAAVTIAIGALVTVGGNEGGQPGRQPDASTQVQQPSGVQLVAYSGKQLEGFIVDRTPDGWYLQGSSPFALTIAPEGDATHPDNFVGKLVVMLFSKDMNQELPKGEPVEVGDNQGVVADTGGDITTLSYEDGAGNFIQIQFPEVLGWTNEQFARFAEGVEVTADAQHTRG